MKEKAAIEKTLTITGFSKKGHGTGLWQRENAPDAQVEVPCTLPGETVRVVLGRKRKRQWQARLLEVKNPSPQRQEPRCAHFGYCGGCRWQHLPYSQQLQVKQEIVRQSLSDLLPPGVEILPIIPCDPPWEYRNKMEFSFSRNAAGEQFAGLNLEGGRGKVFNLTECHLVHPWFAQGVEAARHWAASHSLSAYHPYSDTGSLRTLILREGFSSGDRLAMLTVSGNPDFALNRRQMDAFVKKVEEHLSPEEGSLSVFVRIQQIAKGSPTQFFEMHLSGPDTIRESLTLDAGDGLPFSLDFKISPSAFFQPNTRQAEKLYSAVLRMARVSETGHAYDLYCGTGTLGICLGKKARRVTAVEISPEAALDARTNAALNGMENLEVFTGDVGKILETRAGQDHGKADVVLVDPPRAGLDDRALKNVLALEPKQILYVSCNPSTQAENLKGMTANGYRVEQVQPVDQFPHTVHIENIVSLSRSDHRDSPQV